MATQETFTAAGEPASHVDEVCRHTTQELHQRFHPTSVALYLYDKCGALVLRSGAGNYVTDLPATYSSDDPHIGPVVGVAKRRGSVQTAITQGRKYSIRVPLDGPNRTFGVLEVLFPREHAPIPDSDLGGIVLRGRHAALQISGVRRRLELDALNQIREFISRAKPPLPQIFDAVTHALVAEWTEYSAALLRVRSAGGAFVLVSKAAVHGLEFPDRDSQPRQHGVGIVGNVLDTGQSVFISDIDSYDGEFADRIWADAHKLKAYACVPVQREHKTVGALSLFVGFNYEFYETKRRFITNLCEQVATSINIDRLYRAQERMNSLTEGLLAPDQDATRMLHNAVAAARELIDGDFGYIATATKNDRHLHPVASTQDLDVLNIPILELDGPGLTPLVFATKKAINCDDVRKGDCGKSFVDLKGELSTRVKSEIVVPMMYEGEPVGVVDIESITPAQFTNDDRAILEAIANHATLAFEKQRFYNASRTLAALRLDMRDREGMYQRIVETAGEIADASAVCLYVLDETSGELRVATFLNAEPLAMAELASLSIPSGLGRTWEAINKREVTATSGIADDAVYYHKEFARAHGFVTMLTIPIWLDQAGAPPSGAVYGAINILAKRDCRFVEAEVTLLKALSTAAAFALQDSRNRETLELAYERAEVNARLISVAEIAAGVAHDARGVLSRATTAFGAARPELRRILKIERSPLAERELAKLEEALENLTLYLDRLRHYSRFADPQFSDESVNDVIENVLTLLAYRVNRANYRVKKDLRSVPRIRMDPDQISRALINVVSNSFDAMKPRGTLFIGTELYQADRFVRIRIVDDGVSFEDENRARVFEPYYTTKTHGTGMGLPIVKQIVEQSHGGSVEIEPRRGKGTTVHILLPNVVVKKDED